MQEPSSIFQRIKQSVFGTTAWALEKIREAKKKKLATLDLSSASIVSRENLTRLLEEIFELSELTTLSLSGNGLSSLPANHTAAEPDHLGFEQ
jgi:Leucine-rich repeat (LRR) protein